MPSICVWSLGIVPIPIFNSALYIKRNPTQISETGLNNRKVKNISGGRIKVVSNLPTYLLCPSETQKMTVV
jgi:hypothetical protein